MTKKIKQSKIQILQEISDHTKLKQVEVESVFIEMAKLIEAHLKKEGSSEIIIPKLGIKIRKVRRKATNRRSMVSHFTGTEVEIAAKPARYVAKLVALKSLKDMALDEI